MKNKLKNLIEEKDKNNTIIYDLKEKYNNRFNYFNKIEYNPESLEQYKKETNKLNNDIEIAKIKNSIIDNNIDYICDNIAINDLIPILHKYDNKRIGDKTRNRMREEIKSYCLKNYDIQCNLWYKIDNWVSTTYVTINFTFSKKDTNYYNGKISDLEYNLTIKVDNNTTSYDFYGENNYNKKYVNDIDKQAEKLYLDRKTVIAKIEKETKKLNSLIDNYNKNMTNHLSNKSIKNIEVIS